MRNKNSLVIFYCLFCSFDCCCLASLSRSHVLMGCDFPQPVSPKNLKLQQTEEVTHMNFLVSPGYSYKFPCLFRLHEALQNSKKKKDETIESLLLDIDHRYVSGKIRCDQLQISLHQRTLSS